MWYFASILIKSYYSVMKTFIIAAQTLDGFIARKSAESSFDWTSKEDKEFFISKTKEAGVVVMGRTTFQTIGKPLVGRRTIVMSRSEKIDVEGVECTDETPEELCARLEKEGVNEVAIAGGASIYTAFLKAGLVDKIFLTIESYIFGDGIKLFNETHDQKLELISNTKLGESTLLLEYNVIK